MQSVNRSVVLTLAIGAVLSFAALVVKAQTYVFGTASYPAPSIPNTSSPLDSNPVITADFNGDGIPDLAILGSYSTSTQAISIYLGRPDGTFAQKVDYQVAASGFTVGDFTGDGKLDIVVINYLGFPIASILLGNGDGTFQSPVALNLGIANGTYSGVASGDFNGDDKLDLLVFGYGTMAVLLGNGDGTFQTPVTSAVPGWNLVIADFNGDGKPDIALLQSNNSSWPPNTLVSVLINQGDGTFPSPVSYNVTGALRSLAAADLNGDGKLDLVVATGGQTAQVSVLLGFGDGTFASPLTYTSNLLSIYATSIAVADFNGDGKLDLALTNSEAPNNAVAVLQGNGDGTFQNPPLLYSAGLQPAAVVALDVNGDGRPDLAVLGGYSPRFSVTVLINRGDGSFPNRTTFPVSGFAYSAVTADFNGDGKPDIATTGIFSNTSGQFIGGVVSTLLGNGDGTFQSHVDSPTSDFPFVVATGDFNRDGKPDLVVSEGTTTSEFLATWIGNGDGTFQNNISQVTPNSLNSLAVGDFNNDSKLDVAATIFNTNVVYVFLGKGDGTFLSPVTYATAPMQNSPPIHRVFAADLNGDGKLDLAIAADTCISILLGNGDGTFRAHQDILTASNGWQELLGVADFNGDGKPDLVLTSGPTSVFAALGNGDGTFQPAAAFQTLAGVDEPSAVIGDFNGDGKVDLAFASQSDFLTILPGKGDGSFDREIDYAAGSDTSVDFLAKADFNGDGALDAALANSGDKTVSVFLNLPVAALWPSRLVFGTQFVSMSSSEQAVTLTNPGSVPLVISSVVASGDFTARNDCPSTLNVGGSCLVSVTFEPTAEGNRAGTLTFTTNASVVPQTVLLAGWGEASGISLTPSSLTFSAQMVGTSSASQPVQLTNTGNEPLAITSISASGDFTQSNTCGSGLAAGANCSISVTFTPTAGGNRSGTLAINDNAPGSPHTVGLTGTGQDFSLTVTSGSSSSATVTPGQSATYSLSLGGLGGLTQAISLACAGAPSEATCAVSPSLITPSGAGPETITVTVTTTAPSLAPLLQRHAPPIRPEGTIVVLLSLLGLAALAFGRPLAAAQGRVFRLGLGVAVLVAIALAMAACGGGGGGNVQHDPGTPAGIYSLTVTGTVSGSNSLTHSTTLTLKVS